MVLGLNAIKTIAITTCGASIFSLNSMRTWALGRWILALFAQLRLRCQTSFARLTGYEPTDEAYLAGLLHQVGQLIFLKKEPDQYSRTPA